MDPSPPKSRSLLSAPRAGHQSINAQVASNGEPITSTHYVSMGDQHEEQLSLKDEIAAKAMHMYHPSDQGTDDETTITGDPGTITMGDDPSFEDLEFLHDFLEHEARRPFFESNFFACSYKNLCVLLLLLCLLAVGAYLLYYFYWDSYIEDNLFELIKLSSIPIICIAFTYGHIALALWMTFWPVEFFPFQALQWKSGPFKGCDF